jgi:hypothetical protein
MMTAPAIGLAISFVVILSVIFSGALVGMLIGWLLPDHHLSSELKGVVSVAMAVVGTVSALVLGLLISSASSSFATRNSEITRTSTDIIRIDQLLHRYGPEADAARDSLRRYTAMKLNDLFPDGTDRTPRMDNPATFKMLEQVLDAILALSPGNERQRWLLERARQLADEVSETRWLLVEQNAGAIPLPFLILLVFWLTLLFASYGLFAPRNVTAAVALFLCAVAVAGGVEMVLDMAYPFGGLIHISSDPMRHAVEVINQ